MKNPRCNVTWLTWHLFNGYMSHVSSVMKGRMHHFMPLLFFVLVKFDLKTLKWRGRNLLIGQALKVGGVTYEQINIIVIISLQLNKHFQKMLLTWGGEFGLNLRWVFPHATLKYLWLGRILFMIMDILIAFKCCHIYTITKILAIVHGSFCSLSNYWLNDSSNDIIMSVDTNLLQCAAWFTKGLYIFPTACALNLLQLL